MPLGVCCLIHRLARNGREIGEIGISVPVPAWLQGCFRKPRSHTSGTQQVYREKVQQGNAFMQGDISRSDPKHSLHWDHPAASWRKPEHQTGISEWSLGFYQFFYQIMKSEFDSHTGHHFVEFWGFLLRLGLDV